MAIPPITAKTATPTTAAPTTSPSSKFSRLAARFNLTPDVIDEKWAKVKASTINAGKSAAKKGATIGKNVTVNGAKTSAITWSQFGMGAQLLWSSAWLMRDTFMRQPIDTIIQNLKNSVFLQDMGYSMFKYTPESSGNGAWALGTIGVPYFLNGIINSARAEVGNKAADPNAPTKMEKVKAYGNAVADRIPSLAITGYMANLLAKTDIYSLGAKVFGNSNSTEAKAASAALADSLNYTLLGVPVFGVALAIYLGYVGMNMLGAFSKSK